MSTYEIKRETSMYNKSMKWHLITTTKEGCIFSDWYETKKEAVIERDRDKRIDGNLKAAVGIISRLLKL